LPQRGHLQAMPRNALWVTVGSVWSCMRRPSLLPLRKKVPSRSEGG
jgi:hypothetical protein